MNPLMESERIQATSDGGRGNKNKLVSIGQKQHITLKEFLPLHAIFLELTKYSSFHNLSINIYTIFVSLRVFPGLTCKKYVNSY